MQKRLRRVFTRSHYRSSGAIGSTSSPPQLPDLPSFEGGGLWDFRDSSEETPSPHSSIAEAVLASCASSTALGSDPHSPRPEHEHRHQRIYAEFNDEFTPPSSPALSVPDGFETAPAVPRLPLPRLTRVTTLPPRVSLGSNQPLDLDVDLEWQIRVSRLEHLLVHPALRGRSASAVLPTNCQPRLSRAMANDTTNPNAPAKSPARRNSTGSVPRGRTSVREGEEDAGSHLPFAPRGPASDPGAPSSTTQHQEHPQPHEHEFLRGLNPFQRLRH